MVRKKQKSKKPELMIGGQAVIEGVMMRTGDDYAVAIRKLNNRILVKKEKHVSLTKQNKVLGLPLMRGIIMLWETLVLGYKALTFSANQSLREEKDEKDKEKKGKDEKQELGTPEFVITLIISIVFALALFKFLPLLIATLLKNQLGGSNILFNIIDGASKIIILILYLFLISFLKDVKRLFQYHGAEHKVVHCYEHNKKLTVKNVRTDSKAHARCGTTFILVVLFLSVIFYLVIPFNMNFWLKLLIRIIFLPIIAGISYEWIKFSAKRPDYFFTRILIAPGLLVQSLTTREPDNEQIEVAIKALKAVMD